ncbi:MAG: YceI family protein [Bacteroidetes bacterium]|nr:YceI family protein [Bacteroidota bacterium]
MATTKWTMDAAHSEIQFKVRHMVVSNVTGSFGKFNADVETDGEDITTAKVHFTADIDSISTNNEQRDNHLKSADFFDGATHPQLTFESTKIEKVDGSDYKMHGNISIRGTVKPITLNVEFGGIVNDPWGNVRAGFTVEGKLNRKDFGLNWSAITEAGHLVVSDDVRIHANAEFIKQG